MRKKPIYWGVAAVIAVLAIITAEIAFTGPTRGAMRTYAALLAAANRPEPDLGAIQSLCTGRYVAAHPITAVTLSDRQPFDAPGHRASYDWATEQAGIVVGVVGGFADLPHVLPEELFRRLPTPDADWGGTHAAYFGRTDATRRARALGALSAACVRYGRELVGLPSIPAPKI